MILDSERSLTLRPVLSIFKIPDYNYSWGRWYRTPLQAASARDSLLVGPHLLGAAHDDREIWRRDAS